MTVSEWRNNRPALRPTTRTWLVRRLPLLLISVGVILTLLPAVEAQAAPCDPPITNPVACENTKPGNPASEWDVSGGGSSNIEGFATDISVDQGQTIQFKVDTNSSNYRIDIYRLGYYGGMGARKVGTVEPSASLPQNQPNCLTNQTTGLVDCGNWAVSASWAVPTDAVSGIYLGKLVREDGTSGANHIAFIVRDDDGHSDLLFQTSDTTWQAYNQYGGNSLYSGSPRRPGVQGQLQPAFHHSFLLRRGLALQRRVPDDPVPREERLQRQLLHWRGHGPPRRRAPRTQGLHVRRT